MRSRELRILFQERRQEVDHYLGLLEIVENATKPFGNRTVPNVDQDHLKILRSHMYLHLYNLVEATMSWCLAAAAEAPRKRKSWRPRHLIPEMLSELVKYSIGGSTNHDKIAVNATTLTQKVINGEPMQMFDFVIQKRAGNWNQTRIRNTASALGVHISLSPTTRKNMFSSNYVDRIWKRRNELAHGDLSFAQAGADTSLTDLKDFCHWTATYLSEILESYCRYVDYHEFLLVRYRPKRSSSAIRNSN